MENRTKKARKKKTRNILKNGRRKGKSSKIKGKSGKNKLKKKDFI